MKLQTFDIVFLIGYAVIVIPMFISLFFDYTTVLTSIGDWLVMLTHILIIPVIIIDMQRKWYVYLLVYSLFTSVVYHIAKIGYIGMLFQLGTWDIAVQNALMLSTLCLLLFDPQPIPEWLFFLIGASAVFIAALGETDVGGDIRIYEIVGAIALTMLIIYLVYRFLNPTPLRNNTYITISAISAIIACISFFVSGNLPEEKYSMCHSIWHITAFLMLYFTMKSMNTEYTSIRVKRQAFS